MSRYYNKRLFIISLLKEIIVMKIKFLVVTAILFLTSCSEKDSVQLTSTNSLINTSHLDSLYEEINVEGKSMGIIHIYSNYPDYKWIGDDDEGIACVDDAARATIFYLRNYQSNNDTASLTKAKQLTRLLLFMQSENGFFYNFILEDHSINKTHRNSINIADWWSWRAMWTLSESYKVFKTENVEFSKQILKCLETSVEATKKSFPKVKSVIKIDGMEYPNWLPYETAGDQASILVVALINYLRETGDTSVTSYINDLCDGILLMQKGDSENIPFYAFLSWQNLWHAYGNSQSYALLKALEVLKRNDLKISALNEINSFYDYLIEENYLSSFGIKKVNDAFEFSESKQFSQIAYNFRPIIYACLEAFKLTNDSVYVFKSIEISKWFFGKNIAGTQMYYPSTGRCFDGINSENDVNMNSGAESTIEALLSLQAIEINNVSEELLQFH